MSATNASAALRCFALVSADADTEPAVALAWGMTLPDDSVMVVGWRDGQTTVVALCRSIGNACRMYDGADVRWLDQQPTVMARQDGEVRP